MTYEETAPIDRTLLRPASSPVTLALSVIFHLVILVAIPLLSGLFHTTQRFERPRTFQLVTAPRQPAPALPAQIPAASPKQAAPRHVATPPSPQAPVPDVIKSDQVPQTANETALPASNLVTTPAAITTGTLSPGPATPAAPVATSGVPQRLGSTAELDNMEFEPIYSVKPDYPVVAQEARITGYVDADLLIAENGTVKSFSIVTVKGHAAFGVETARVLPRWRFPPPRIGGKKCSVKYLYRINFTLN